MALSTYKPRHHVTKGGEEWDIVDKLKLSRRSDGQYKIELGDRENGWFRRGDIDKIKELLGELIDHLETHATKARR